MVHATILMMAIGYPAQGEPTPREIAAKVAAMVDQAKSERQAEIDRLSAMKVKTVSGRRKRDEAIARLKSAPKKILPPMLHAATMKVCDIGVLSNFDDGRHNNHTRVMQVISPMSFLGEVVNTGQSGTTVRTTVWFYGWPTERMRTDQKLHLDKVVIVGGTKTYNTPIGTTRTVMVVKPFWLGKALPDDWGVRRE